MSRSIRFVSLLAALLTSTALAAAGEPAPSKVPPLPPSLRSGGGDVSSASADALVARDQALKADAKGATDPAAAASAWTALAKIGDRNPWRGGAAKRAAQWGDYARKEEALTKGLARDTARLRKILPLTSIDAATKLALIDQFVARHGVAAAVALGRLVEVEDGGSPPMDGVADPRLYEASCKKGDPVSCYDLGALYSSGSGVAKDDAKADALYQRACDAGESSGCASLGSALLRGDGITSDPSKAVVLLAEACDAGVAVACTDLGFAYSKGSGVVKDAARANALAAEADKLDEDACDRGDPRGCYDLSFAYAFGRGVGKDVAKSNALFEKACGMDYANACEAAAYGLKDPAKAHALFEKACSLGDQIACKQAHASSEASTPPPAEHASSSGSYTAVGTDAGDAGSGGDTSAATAGSETSPGGDTSSGSTSRTGKPHLPPCPSKIGDATDDPDLVGCTYDQLVALYPKSDGSATYIHYVIEGICHTHDGACSRCWFPKDSDPESDQRAFLSCIVDELDHHGRVLTRADYWCPDGSQRHRDGSCDSSAPSPSPPPPPPAPQPYKDPCAGVSGPCAQSANQ